MAEAERVAVVRRQTQRLECSIVYDDGDWAIWFARNRRIGANNEFGGPSLIILRRMFGVWLPLCRWDLFGFLYFCQQVISHHLHYHAENLYDHDQPLKEGLHADSFEAMLCYLDNPELVAEMLRLTFREDVATTLPREGMREAAATVRALWMKYLAELKVTPEMLDEPGPLAEMGDEVTAKKVAAAFNDYGSLHAVAA